MAGSPIAAASSAALTARSIDSRSTPGMASTEARARVPSIRKIGQMRSSVVSEVSRTSRRDQSARRLRRSRVAGKPDPAGGCVLPPARLARSVRNDTGLDLEDDDTWGLPCSLTKLPASYHPGFPAANLSRRTWFANSAGYWQRAECRRAFMSRWKWFLWASFASGPSTVPNTLQASSCTALTNLLFASRSDWDAGNAGVSGLGGSRRSGRSAPWPRARRHHKRIGLRVDRDIDRDHERIRFHHGCNGLDEAHTERGRADRSDARRVVTGDVGRRSDARDGGGTVAASSGLGTCATVATWDVATRGQLASTVTDSPD